MQRIYNTVHSEKFYSVVGLFYKKKRLIKSEPGQELLLDQANQHIIKEMANKRMHYKSSQFLSNCMAEIASFWKKVVQICFRQKP